MNYTIVAITIYIITVLAIVLVLNLIQGLKNKKYRKVLDNLEVEKNVIDKMISIDPHKRYQDMQEIIRRLDQLFYQNKLIERKEQNYCLPGFRSHKIWKMILAVMGYGLAIELVSTFKIEGQATVLDYFVYRMILILWFVITLVLSTNYLSLRDYLPYYKGQKTLIKVISTIVSWFVLMLGVLLVGTFFIALFK